MQSVEIAVAGVTHDRRQVRLQDLFDAQAYGVGIGAKLLREPNNPHDPNAIAVHAWTRTPGAIDYHIGFVPRILAAQMAPRMDAGEEFPVRAVRIIAGEHDGRTTYGVRLDVANVIREGITK